MLVIVEATECSRNAKLFTHMERSIWESNDHLNFWILITLVTSAAVLDASVQYNLGKLLLDDID
jgi:hypothetical protein